MKHMNIHPPELKQGSKGHQEISTNLKRLIHKNLMLTKMNLFWTDKLFSPFSDIIIDNTQPNNYKHHYIFPSDQTASFFL